MYPEMTHSFKIAIVFLLVSCNKKKDKEYTCTCNIHGTPHTTVTKSITSKSSSDAFTQCSDYGKSQAGSAHYECNVQ